MNGSVSSYLNTFFPSNSRDLRQIPLGGVRRAAFF